MNDSENNKPLKQPKPVYKSFWQRVAIVSFVFLLFVMITLSLIYYHVIGWNFKAPDWVRNSIEIRSAEALGSAELNFDALDLLIDSSLKPQVLMTNVKLTTKTGIEIIAFSEVRAELSLSHLIQGQLQLTNMSVSGVFVSLRRLPNGSIVVSGGLDITAPHQQAATVAQLINRFDRLLNLPILADLTSAEIQALNLRIEDQSLERIWTIDGGRLSFKRDGNTIQAKTDLALLNGGQGVATLEANYKSIIGATAADFGLNIKDIEAGDLAALAPPFAWLNVLHAPISGSLMGGITDEGSLLPVNATLAIGEGVLQPIDETRPIPFSSARSYFRYDPALSILTFDELSVVSPWITGEMIGQAFLDVSDIGGFENLVGRFKSDTVQVNPDDLYTEAISIESVEMDFKLLLNPFRLHIGQLLLHDNGQTLQAEASLETEPDGWSYNFDAHLDGLSSERLLAIWPSGLKPRTRRWISENIIAGSLSNIDAVLRGQPGLKPNLFLGFTYEKGVVRYAKNLPFITDANGTATLLNDRFVATLNKGQVKAKKGGIVDVSGTSFIIPDVTFGPGAPSVVRLKTSSYVTGMLSLLDQPPLSIMKKAGRDPTIADGRLKVAGTLSMPLRRGLKSEDFTFSMLGTASDIVSTKVVEGRFLEAKTLQISADNLGVTISGKGMLDKVAFDVVWNQPLGNKSMPSKLEGSLELSEHMLKAFSIGLPSKMVSGEGSANIELALPLRGGAPSFRLDSNLTGLQISAPWINWSKPAATYGKLSIAGVLSNPPRVDNIDIDVPGLKANGSITLLEADGGLNLARFDAVQVGEWIKGPVDLVGRGAGVPPAIVVRAGILDLRKANFGGDDTKDGVRKNDKLIADQPISVSLELLQVTDTISLTDLNGEFDLSGGFNGKFKAKVNNGATVNGHVLPQNGRSAVLITSDEAGGVAASLGIFKKARGGTLSLTLLPIGDASFDGVLNVTDTSIQDAPFIGTLLNAISIVGLFDQLDGSGIRFQDVEAKFRLNPSNLVLTQASAVGPSIGLSMDGTLDAANSILDMRGVISPIYLLNGIGSFLTRKGEGLIGFNYTLSGQTSEPKVTVNPMSALTPGVFRDLFRTASPNLSTIDGNGDAAVPELPKAFVLDAVPNLSSEEMLEERQQRLDDR